MAEVYLVTNKSTGGKQALKLLKSGDPGVATRLQREAQVQARLLHPNIVSVSDLVQVDGQPGLVMEYVDGPSLDAWLQTAEPDLSTRLTVFRAILRGLARAHAEGVVHRDLSPRNILIQRTSHGPHPKITDFGLAKLLDPGAGPAQTRAGAPLGTPAYMAPEQVRDAATVDARADIWALGALLYLLATDRLAFEGRDLLDTWNRVTEGRYPPLPASVPEAVRRTVVACLQVDPTQRPPDVAAVEALLEEAAPVVRRPVSGVAVAIAATLGLVAAGVVWLGRPVEEEPPAVVEAAPPVVEEAPAAVEEAPAAVEELSAVEARPAKPAAAREPAWSGATWSRGAGAPAGLCLQSSKGGTCLPPGPVAAGSYRLVESSGSRTSLGLASVPSQGALVATCRDGGCTLDGT